MFRRFVRRVWTTHRDATRIPKAKSSASLDNQSRSTHEALCAMSDAYRRLGFFGVHPQF